MSGKIKLLVLEDSELDAELMIRELRHFDQPLVIKIVSTKPEFEELVLGWEPDLIISDFNLRTFNGDEALEFAKQNMPNTPFITLSGSITQEMELKLLKNRANDVLTKGNLKRLPFAIRRVLNERTDKQKLDNTLFELAGNLKFQEALAEISIRFNSSESFDSKINYALEVLGKMTDVSRVYMFEDFNNGKYCKNTYEWSAEGVEPQIQELQNVSYLDDIPSWKPYLIKEGSVYASNIEDLPVDIREILKPQNIKAIIVYPVQMDDEFIGFIGFDEVRNNRKWTISEDKLLKSVSGIISNAYSENLARKELVTKNEELSNLLNEKEVLVGEVHHRVKNNLALISSFLQLEQLGVSTSDNKDQIISANILRIKSIAIVHETVYQLGSFSNINVLDVLEQIIEVSYIEKVKMKPVVNIHRPESPVTFNINIAVPFSLLISELMFKVLSLDNPDDFTPNEDMYLSTSENENDVTITIGESTLAKVILKLQEADKFSEIIEVLARQIGAILTVDEENGRTNITFDNKKLKGSSSSLS